MTFAKRKIYERNEEATQSYKRKQGTNSCVCSRTFESCTNGNYWDLLHCCSVIAKSVYCVPYAGLLGISLALRLM